MKTFIVLRIVMALVFLWAFFDKLFGLGFATAPEKSWLSGGSPTTGFLTHGTHGPFTAIFQSLAGIAIVDWLFMLGLLFIGLTLLFNRYIKWGAVAGIVMMSLMYLATLPPENHPFIDEHIVYALVLGILGFNKQRV
jgi:thiosulfate dehydrogenase (quinone) large subunit